MEREQLKTQHKQERDGRVRDRIKAVLLTDKGWSSEAIAEAQLISDQEFVITLEIMRQLAN